MSYIGDFPEDFATVSILFTTHAASGAPVAPSSGFEAADVAIFKNGSATEKTSTNGLTMTSPFNGTTGLHCLVIDTSNDTGDVGFWVAGAQYTVVLVPDETVDSLAVAKVIGTFGLALAPVFARVGAPVGATISADVAGLQSDTNDIQTRLPAALVSGRIDASVGAMAAGVVTATAIAADAITDAKVASDVTIASVTGAVGSVTGNVGGNVTGSVGSVASGGITSGSFAAGAIDNAAIAADAIGSSELAASAVTEIQSGLSTLDAAGVRAAVGLASANLDTQLAAIDDFIDTEVSAIKAKTDNLPSDPADASDIAAALTSLQTHGDSAWATATGFSTLNAAGVRAAVGLASANLDTQLDALPTTAEVNAEVDTALSDAGVTGARMAHLDADVSSRLASGSYTAPANATIAAIDAKTTNLPPDPADQSLIIDATTTLMSRLGAPAGASVSADIATRASQTSVDDLPTNAELATALGTADDAVLAAIAALTIPTASANAAAMLAAAYEGAETFQDFLRLTRAALVGKASGLAGTTVHYRDAADGKDRILATVDADGNRSAVTVDAS